MRLSSGAPSATVDDAPVTMRIETSSTWNSSPAATGVSSNCKSSVEPVLCAT